MRRAAEAALPIARILTGLRQHTGIRNDALGRYVDGESKKHGGAGIEGINSREDLLQASSTKGIAVRAHRYLLVDHGDAGGVQVTICACVVEGRVREKIGTLADLRPGTLTDEAYNYRPIVVLGFGAVAVPDVPDICDDVAVAWSAASVCPGSLPKPNDWLVGQRLRRGWSQHDHRDRSCQCDPAPTNETSVLSVHVRPLRMVAAHLGPSGGSMRKGVTTRGTLLPRKGTNQRRAVDTANDSIATAEKDRNGL